MAENLAAIVTAAGASTRMGEHKALLSWRGRPLIAHQVHTLREADFDPIVVVTGAESEAVESATPDEATTVYNREWRSGRSSSIRAGAREIPDTAEAILVVAVDQPLAQRVLDELVPSAGDPLVQPVDGDGRPGHPVLVGGAYLSELRTLTDESEGLRSLVRGLRPEGTTVSVEDLPHWDLNTPESYRSARAEAGGEGTRD